MEERDGLFEKWRSQARKGFLDLCVLAAIEQLHEVYGLELMTRLRDAGMDVSEGTIYPLLMRMTKEGSLSASWTTPPTGHPRKYYQLSPGGRLLLEAMREEYARNIRAYERLGEGGSLR